MKDIKTLKLSELCDCSQQMLRELQKIDTDAQAEVQTITDFANKKIEQVNQKYQPMFENKVKEITNHLIESEALPSEDGVEYQFKLEPQHGTLTYWKIENGNQA